MPVDMPDGCESPPAICSGRWGSSNKFARYFVVEILPFVVNSRSAELEPRNRCSHFMSISISDFWQHAVDHNVLTSEQCRELDEEFAVVMGTNSNANARSLAEWLIATNRISRADSKVLLRPRSIPIQPSTEDNISRTVDTSVSQALLARKAKPFNLPLWSAVCTTAIAAIIGLAIVSRSGRDVETSKSPEEQQRASPDETDGDLPSERRDEDTDFELVDDDGQSLWASPTDGPPIKLRFLPPETQFVLSVNLKELRQAQSGSLLMRSLGPDFDKVLSDWLKSINIRLDEIVRLQLSLVPHEDTRPRAVFVVELGAARDITGRWNSATRDDSSQIGEVYNLGGWTLIVPNAPAEKQTTLVVGDSEVLRELMESKLVLADGSALPLPTAMEKLRRQTDATRHITLLVDPHFFFADGGGLLADNYAKLRQPLKRLLEDPVGSGRIRSALFSLDLHEICYGEIQYYGTIDRDAYQLADRLKTYFRELPDRVDEYLITLDVPPYWKRLSLRLPIMARELRRQSRFGVDGRRAIANFALPIEAAHNLVMAVDLAVHTVSSEPTTTIATSALTIQQLLNVKLSIDIPQTSLEFAVRDLAEIVADKTKEKLTIQIIGGDLQKEGITRNQQIRNFQVTDESVADILTRLVMRANPVTTVQEPNEIDQKLVWATVENADPAAGQVILITTRSAAAEKGISLPSAFQN